MLSLRSPGERRLHFPASCAAGCDQWSVSRSAVPTPRCKARNKGMCLFSFLRLDKENNKVQVTSEPPAALSHRVGGAA